MATQQEVIRLAPPAADDQDDDDDLPYSVAWHEWLWWSSLIRGLWDGLRRRHNPSGFLRVMWQIGPWGGHKFTGAQWAALAEYMEALDVLFPYSPANKS